MRKHNHDHDVERLNHLWEAQELLSSSTGIFIGVLNWRVCTSLKFPNLDDKHIVHVWHFDMFTSLKRRSLCGFKLVVQPDVSLEWGDPWLERSKMTWDRRQCLQMEINDNIVQDMVMVACPFTFASQRCIRNWNVMKMSKLGLQFTLLAFIFVWSFQKLHCVQWTRHFTMTPRSTLHWLPLEPCGPQ